MWFIYLLQAVANGVLCYLYGAEGESALAIAWGIIGAINFGSFSITFADRGI